MEHQHQYELIGLMAERDSAIEILAELDAENRDLKAKQHVLKIQNRAKDRLIASLQPTESQKSSVAITDLLTMAMKFDSMREK